jgi:Fic family protein
MTLASEPYDAFVPHPLPPAPPLALSDADHERIHRAAVALGRLDVLGLLLPDTHLFVYLYVRKEAVLSSQIEGTRSSLSDLLLHESEQAPGVPHDDVVEVSNYVAAIEHGLRRMRSDLPLSVRLMRQMHEILLRSGRGASKRPGELRTSQVWIGGASAQTADFVPPPPDDVPDCMAALERFLHGEPSPTPVLIRAALAHAQFETIHPFLDGNGRLGRLLIPILLCSENVLKEPTLYLSLYFKTHREAYYERLQRVRTHGEWEEWVRFFMEGVLYTAEEAITVARRILALFEADRARILGLGRGANAALRVHDVLQRRPIVSIQKAAEAARVSGPTAAAAMQRLAGLGLVRELTGRQRGRLFAYDPYVALLNEGAGA